MSRNQLTVMGTSYGNHLERESMNNFVLEKVKQFANPKLFFDLRKKTACKSSDTKTKAAEMIGRMPMFHFSKSYHTGFTPRLISLIVNTLHMMQDFDVYAENVFMCQYFVALQVCFCNR